MFRPSGNGSGVSSGALRQAMLDLCYAEWDSLVSFSFIVLDNLVYMLAANVGNLGPFCIEVLARLAQRLAAHVNSPATGCDAKTTSSACHAAKKRALLVRYIKHACRLPVAFHNALIANLIHVLSGNSNNSSSNVSTELVVRNIWFFLELLIKAVGVHVHSQPATCQQPLSAQFYADLNTLSRLLIAEIASGLHRHQKQQQQQQQQQNKQQHCNEEASEWLRVLNQSLAEFFNEMISTVNRGRLIIDLLETYMIATSAHQLATWSAVASHSLQLDMWRRVSSHEHFVALNLPSTNTRIAPPTSIDYYQRHYFAGTLMRLVATALHSPSARLQRKAALVLRELLDAHDSDARFDGRGGGGGGERRARASVATLYAPLLHLVVHFAPRLVTTRKHHHHRHHHAIEMLPSVTDDDELPVAVGQSAHGHDLDLDMQLLIGGGDHEQNAACCSCRSVTKQWCGDGEEEEDGGILFAASVRHDLLACLLWLLKHMDGRALQDTLASWPLLKLNKMLALVDTCLVHFEYRHTPWSPTVFAHPIQQQHNNQHSQQQQQQQPAAMAAAATTSNSSSSSNNKKFKNKIEDLLSGGNGSGGSSGGNANDLLKRTVKQLSMVSLNASNVSSQAATAAATRYQTKQNTFTIVLSYFYKYFCNICRGWAIINVDDFEV